MVSIKLSHDDLAKLSYEIWKSPGEYMVNIENNHLPQTIKACEFCELFYIFREALERTLKSISTSVTSKNFSIYNKIYL